MVPGDPRASKSATHAPALKGGAAGAHAHLSSARLELAGEHADTQDVPDRRRSDAQKAVDNGLLESPFILNTTCQPAGGGRGEVNGYDCLAANEKHGKVSKGYSYRGTVNARSGEISWQLGR